MTTPPGTLFLTWTILTATIASIILRITHQEPPKRRRLEPRRRRR